MGNISRSQWYRKKISNFLNSNEKEIFILLYGREIKYVAKRFQEKLTITPGTCAGITDNRKICRLSKK